MLRRVAPPIVAALILLAIAEIGIRAAQVPAFYIVPPSEIATAIRKNFDSLADHAASTVLVAIAGFAAANIAAIGVAVGVSFFPLLRRAVLPWLVVLQSLPIVAIAPFMQIWFGPGFFGKFLLATLICYFPATLFVASAIAAPPVAAIDLYRSIGASRRELYVSVAIPAAVPAIAAAMQVTATLSFVGAVVAEISGTNQGLGYLIVHSSYRYDTPLLFATLAVLAAVAYAFYHIVHIVSSLIAAKFTVTNSGSSYV